MSQNLENTILDSLSPNTQTRKKAEETITNYFNSMQINDLSIFYSILKTSTDNNVKIFVSIFIKNFIEQKINAENREKFIEYLNQYKYDILNIILNSNLENKTNNLLILSFCKGFCFFQIDMNNYFKIIYELSSYILKFYINQRNTEPKDVNIITKTLFICSKFIKYIDKDINNIKYENIYKIDKLENNEDIENSINNCIKNFELLNANFYNILVDDYNKLYLSIYNSNNSINEEMINNNKYILEYLILYLKIFKYSLNYVEMINGEKILDITYNLNVWLINGIMYNNNLSSHSFLIKIYTEILSLSNKFIIRYL